MRSLLLLVFLLVVVGLAGCGPAPEQPVVLVPTATPGPTTPVPVLLPDPTFVTGTATCLPSATEPPTRTPTPTASATHRPTHPPTFTPSATQTPTPQPLPPRTPVAGEPISLSLGWQFNGNGHLSAGGITSLSGQPTFLLSSLGRTVYALTEGGEVRWKARMAGPVYALASLKGDSVAAGDDAGFVSLLDAGGRRLWWYDLGSRVTALHGGWQGGLLAGGWDERLSFLNADGQVLWQSDVGGPVSGITILADLGIAATLDGDVRAFDPSSAEVWRFESGAPVARLGAFGEGDGSAILVGLQDGRLLLLDADGALRWQQTVGTGGPTWYVADLVNSSALEIVVGTGGDEPVLTLLSAEGGVLWRLTLPSPAGAINVLDLDGDRASEILVGLASGEIQAFDGSGRLRGSVHAGLSVWGLEAAGDGSVLVLADVVARRLVGGVEPAGGPWLPPPLMVPPPSNSLPPGTEQVQDGAVLVFLGDVALGRTMEVQLARYGAAYPWTGLGPLVREADLAMANLEGVLTTQGKPLDKLYLLRAHPRWSQTLVAAGIDLVTLANNHALDYRSVGLDETLATLETLNIATVGAGRSRDEAHQPALFTLNGVRVAILSYAASRWNGSVDVPTTERIAWAYPADVQADVREVHDEADIVVVVLHAGTEYAANPSSDQVAVARAAIDAGADLVVGHHPHVTQTVEHYKQGLVVYSLGDALFDIPRPAAMRGHLLRVHVTRDGLVQAELWPFWIEDAIRPRLLDDGQGAPRFRIIYPLRQGPGS